MALAAPGVGGLNSRREAEGKLGAWQRRTVRNRQVGHSVLTGVYAVVFVVRCTYGFKLFAAGSWIQPVVRCLLYLIFRRRKYRRYFVVTRGKQLANNVPSIERGTCKNKYCKTW